MSSYSLNQHCVWPNYPYGGYYPQGYTCSRCGAWVAYHSSHDCAAGWADTWTTSKTWKQTPHKCPVCEGRQTVASGFYGDSDVLIGSGRVTCRTCSGLGMIWA